MLWPNAMGKNRRKYNAQMNTIQKKVFVYLNSFLKLFLCSSNTFQRRPIKNGDLPKPVRQTVQIF